ncbi:arginyl-tRNA synthetase [Salinibacterium sp. SYSU T00001]|uniref:arginyl-tRNA synthetase n=1 Tax=Homoserinimonas sedimenticola TaxID=2986805 RepID=UPI002235C8A9|nr:arginyl-tRNA synthetase [Salinibacterium sedimenticola]MCW4386649.1 arginyl-tRNA synthetase [Salinibacterium sedimenticola]
MNSLDSLATTPPRASMLHRTAGIGVAVVLALSLVACAGEDPAPKPSETQSSSPSANPSPSEEPNAEPSAPPAEATPVGITCSQLITADDIYAYNPNLTLVDGQTPESGSPGARAVAAEGIACHYMNLTSGESIVVSASSPGPDALAQVRSELSGTATPAEGLGGEGWFGDGTATVISGPYLVTASSDFFTAAADAQQLTTTAISHLG